MLKTELDSLVEVELSKVWADEAADFTPWLAEPENLRLLGEAVDLNLVLEGQEVGVGPYRADIVCRDPECDVRVIIENQLACTDHSHLGQILTYAAGLHADAVIWIASEFTEQHRAAIDWLNDKLSKANGNPGFYGIQIELVKIGQSRPAPRFNVVCKPNAFIKELDDGNITDGQRAKLSYWEALKNHIQVVQSSLKLNRPGTSSYLHFRTPVVGYSFGFEFGSRDGKWISVYVVVRGDEERAGILRTIRDRGADRLKEQIRCNVEWSKDNGSSGIWFSVWTDGDAEQKSDWPRQHAWLVSTAEKLAKLFPELELAARESLGFGTERRAANLAPPVSEQPR